MRVLRPNRSISAGSSVYVAIQHSSMPIAPITAKSAKPLKLVAASEPYAIAAPSEATAVGRSVPTIAAAIASSTSCAPALLEVARDQQDAVVDAVAGDDRAEERGRRVEVADGERGGAERDRGRDRRSCRRAGRAASRCGSTARARARRAAAVTRLDSTMPLRDRAVLGDSAVTTPPVKPIVTPGCAASDRRARTSSSASSSCSPRSTSVVAERGARPASSAILPSALTFVGRSSLASASRRFARRSSSCFWSFCGRRVVVLVEIDVERVRLELGRARCGACSASRALLEIRRAATNRWRCALEERARLGVVVLDALDQLGGELRATPPRISSATAAARSAASAPATTTSTRVARLDPRLELAQVRTAGASCGSRYEKSAYSGRRNAIR